MHHRNSHEPKDFPGLRGKVLVVHVLMHGHGMLGVRRGLIFPDRHGSQLVLLHDPTDRLSRYSFAVAKKLLRDIEASVQTSALQINPMNLLGRPLVSLTALALRALLPSTVAASRGTQYPALLLDRGCLYRQRQRPDPVCNRSATGAAYFPRSPDRAA